MKYFRLLLVNLFRKKIRTGLTIGSFAIAMLLFGLLVIVRFAFNQGVEVAGADRLIVMNRVTFIEPLPISYMDRIAAIPGVKAVSHATWFGGTYQDPKNFFPQFAVDPETWHAMYPEYLVPDDELKAFVADRQAAIAGSGDRQAIRLENWRPHPDRGHDLFRPLAIQSSGHLHRRAPQGRYDSILVSVRLPQRDHETKRNRYGVDHPGWYVVKLDEPG